MAKGVRRDARQSSVGDDLASKLFEAAHPPAAPARRKYKIVVASPWKAPQHVKRGVRQWTHRFAGFRVVEAGGASDQIEMRPSQAKRLAAAPARERQEPERIDRGRPCLILECPLKPGRERRKFLVRKPTVAAGFRELADAGTRAA